jgi:hypothetical protein
LELPWALGPPDGRYLIRREGDPPDAAPVHVLVLATLGAPERRRISARRRSRKAQPEPEPTPVATARATIIDVGSPLDAADQAAAWLTRAGEVEFGHDLAVLNRTLHAYRLATADPHLHAVSRHDALVARIGYGAGEQVADGLWTDARELLEAPGGRRRRQQQLGAQARLAAVLTGRRSPLATEELTLRARLDLDQDRPREAVLQTLVALDAALAELPGDSGAPALSDRLEELRSLHDGVSAAARGALTGSVDAAGLQAATHALGRIEAALRARAAALPG